MFDLEAYFAATPKKVPFNEPNLSEDDAALIRFCEKLEGEGLTFKEDIGLEQRIEQAYDYVEGRQIAVPRAERRHVARVVANFIRSNLERKIGQLTDTVPQLLVKSMSGQVYAANTLRDVIKGLWAERSGQQFLTRSIYRASTAGFSAGLILWDKSLDYGLGDVSLDMVLSRQVIVDPYLNAAYALQDRAEYVILKTVRPLSEFKEMYKRGYLVTPEPAFSQYRNTRIGEERTLGSSKIYRRPSRQAVPTLNGAVPRAIEYRCYFKDRTVDPLQPRLSDGRPNYLFPGKRLIVWSRDVPLYDGPSGYWDGLYPLEILEWGIEAENAYGESEITPLTTLQAAINILVSGVVDNARLVNNPPWVIDDDALDEETEQELINYGDRAGWPFFKKAGSHMERYPPGEMSQMVFNTLQMLQGYLEQAMGVTDVIQGQQPGDVSSGIALESLATAAQITIRMQARAVENWLQRLGRLLISRIIQFYTDERVKYAVNDWGDSERFVFNRQQFFQELGILKTANPEEYQKALQNLFRDLRFSVVPGSSLPGPQRQKTAEALGLRAQGMMSRKRVLEISGDPTPEETLRAHDDEQEEMALRAQQQQLKLQQMMMAQQAMMMPPGMVPQGPPPQEGQPPKQVESPSGKPTLPQKERQTPVVQQGGAGGRQ